MANHSAGPRLALIALVLCWYAIAATPAQALDFTVTTTADPANDFSCLPGSCSLRQAANVSNLLPDEDRITVPAGRYTLNAGFGPLWMLNGPLTVDGAGATTTVIDGGGATGVMLIGGSSAATISNLTVTGGAGQIGAGITISSTQPATISNVVLTGNTAVANVGSGAGGAIFVASGGATITNSTLSGNRAQGSATDGIGGSGGAIAAFAKLTIDSSTISGNVAESGGSPGGSVGGGISTLLDEVTLTNSTVTGNAADKGGGIAGADSLIGLASSTVAANSATTGSNNYFSGGLTTYTNTIVSGGGCAGTAIVLTGGRNLDGSGQCGMGTYDIKGIDPQLGSLAANGGPTQTMLPAASSPVIDAGIGCPPPTVDQRGVARPQGPACDIGAVEAPATPVPTVTPAIQGMTLSPTRFTPSDSGTAVIARKRRAIGTVVSFRLPSLASVRISIDRKSRGRYRPVKGSFTIDGNVGPNSFRFSGRMRNRKLSPGSYRMTAVPTDTAGRKGQAVQRRFKIVRR